ncbi:MAG: hypothetical protein HDS21_01860 [Bacteroides sp.]|nr:hypothetical protein [Bacteroides sp.]
MELTLINKLLISALIAAVIGIMVGLIVRRGSDGKVGCGCGIMFPCAILVFIILSFLTPEVIVISGTEGHLSHETKSTTKDIVFPDGTHFTPSLNEKYLVNTSEETLILYPEYYGSDRNKNKVKEMAEEPIIIEHYSAIKLKHDIDLYFKQAPDEISTNSRYDKVEVKWVLENLFTVLEREGYFNEKDETESGSLLIDSIPAD